MFFEERIESRIRTSDKKMMDKIVRADSEKYDNESHFIRCAVLRLMREERVRLKLK
jgi:Arc/MetJ-type ribon-helix-helix transcriptional regulator